MTEITPVVVPAEFAELTPERLKILVELADNISAGRRVTKWIAWFGAFATAIAGLVYYVTGIWKGWKP